MRSGDIKIAVKRRDAINRVSTIVIGLGKTGLSCVHYLKRQGYDIAVMDTRENPPGLSELKASYPDVPVYLGGLNEEVILSVGAHGCAPMLVVSPGISLQEPAIAKAIQQGIPAIGDIELFARVAKAPIVAITGTNGKGTVTTLVGAMAKNAGLNVRIGGNIGTPVLDLLSDTEPNLYVLEISSFQLETTYSLQPAVATVLNISEDHSDRYANRADYVAAKQRIYQGAKNSVWNRDDELTRPQNFVGAKNSRAHSRAPLRSFGLDVPDDGQFGIQQFNNQYWLAFGSERLLAVDELKIKGKHNWANALAALAIFQAYAGAHGCAPYDFSRAKDFSPLQETLCNFRGLAHRCEWVGEWNGINWYDDSKGTNVGATVAALQGLGEVITGKLIWIAGGLGKGADFSPLQLPAAKYAKIAILIGKDAKLLANSLGNVVPIHYANSMEEAVSLARAVAQSGDAVLLSPACASMDMFLHAEQRGDVFQANVKMR